MIWATSIWKLGCSNRSKIHSVQKCYLCLRYVVSPMCPGRTEIKWSGRKDLNLRPPGPEPGALARLRYAPTQTLSHTWSERELQLNIAAPRPATLAPCICFSRRPCGRSPSLRCRKFASEFSQTGNAHERGTRSQTRNVSAHSASRLFERRSHRGRRRHRGTLAFPAGMDRSGPRTFPAGKARLQSAGAYGNARQRGRLL